MIPNPPSNKTPSPVWIVLWFAYWIGLAGSAIASIIIFFKPIQPGPMAGLDKVVGLMFSFSCLGTLVVIGLIPRIFHRRYWRAAQRGADIAISVGLTLLLAAAVTSFLFAVCLA